MSAHISVSENVFSVFAAFPEGAEALRFKWFSSVLLSITPAHAQHRPY